MIYKKKTNKKTEFLEKSVEISSSSSELERVSVSNDKDYKEWKKRNTVKLVKEFNVEKVEEQPQVIFI